MPSDGWVDAPVAGCSFGALVGFQRHPSSPNCLPRHRVGPTYHFADGETEVQSEGGTAQGLQLFLGEAWP